MQRTQVYLTDEQRTALDREAKRAGATLAELVRRAIDRFLAGGTDAREEILRATFGALPDLEVPPRSEWDRGYN